MQDIKSKKPAEGQGQDLNAFDSDGALTNMEMGNNGEKIGAEYGANYGGSADDNVNNASFGSGGTSDDGSFKGKFDSDINYANAQSKTKSKPNEAKRNASYNKYVEKVTPKNNCVANCVKAFITGGAICVLGQALIAMYMMFGIGKEDAALWSTITLVGLSVILTGLNIYPQITAWGGAGSLVPITGFANSVAAPAIEYKAEGEVFGIGCKIFTIAGPVILYGVIVSFVLGILYFLQTIM
jgi:stage V sporulation protein AC